MESSLDVFPYNSFCLYLDDLVPGLAGLIGQDVGIRPEDLAPTTSTFVSALSQAFQALSSTALIAATTRLLLSSYSVLWSFLHGVCVLCDLPIMLQGLDNIDLFLELCH